MNKNRIPRAAQKLEVTFLKDTSAGKSGTYMIAEKTDDGWKGIDGSGNIWRLFLDHLRNGEFCQVRVVG